MLVEAPAPSPGEQILFWVTQIISVAARSKIVVDGQEKIVARLDGDHSSSSNCASSVSARVSAKLSYRASRDSFANSFCRSASGLTSKNGSTRHSSKHSRKYVRFNRMSFPRYSLGRNGCPHRGWTFFLGSKSYAGACFSDLVKYLTATKTLAG